jgi:hypothetical protein
MKIVTAWNRRWPQMAAEASSRMEESAGDEVPKKFFGYTYAMPARS